MDGTEYLPKATRLGDLAGALKAKAFEANDIELDDNGLQKLLNFYMYTFVNLDPYAAPDAQTASLGLHGHLGTLTAIKVKHADAHELLQEALLRVDPKFVQQPHTTMRKTRTDASVVRATYYTRASLEWSCSSIYNCVLGVVTMSCNWALVCTPMRQKTQHITV